MKYLLNVFKFTSRFPSILKIRLLPLLSPKPVFSLLKYCPFLHSSILPLHTLLVAARTLILATFNVFPSLSLCFSTHTSFHLSCFCSPTLSPLFVAIKTNICVSLNHFDCKSFSSLCVFGLSLHIVLVNLWYSSFVSVCLLTLSLSSSILFNCLKLNPSI